MLYDKKWDKEVPGKLEPWQQKLLDAAQIIKSKGWIQWHLQSPEGYCLIGACYAVDKNAMVHCSPYLAKFLGLRITQLINWNDTPGRTKEEVIAALEGAAKQGE